jgi:hypothetical protein
MKLTLSGVQNRGSRTIQNLQKWMENSKNEKFNGFAPKKDYYEMVVTI